MRMNTPALHVTFRDGRAGFYLICTLTALALLSALCLPWLWRGPIWLLTLAYAWYLLRQPQRSGELILAGDSELRVGLDGKQPVNAQLLGSTLISAHLVVLHLRMAEERRVCRIPLWPDSMAQEDFRHLCAALRWYRWPVGRGLRPNKRGNNLELDR